MVRASSRHQTPPSDIPQEVPMFLRKTYHMIDSCDPVIACWSEDGETFVVKDPSRFETEIIPQFFKHSKFTSFVRQLNFYAFRKIKYVDTIRLDPKLEAETANYWRFRHEKFQRGKPHLLTSIKRMTAAQNRAAAEKQQQQQKGATTGTAADCNHEDTTQMKEEIDTLKKRLDEMNRNMSELTNMVQKVSLADAASEVNSTADTVAVGNKRKKVGFDVLPEAVPSTTSIDADMPLADAALDLFLDNSAAADNDAAMFPSDPMEMDAMAGMLDMPDMPDMPSRQPLSPVPSNTTDADFVDQLFTAFDEGDLDGSSTLPEPVRSGNNTPRRQLSSSNSKNHVNNNNNRPDPELMDRLSEALGVLPKTMQESIVDRLIANITSNSFTVGGSGTTTKTVDVVKAEDATEVGESPAPPTPEVAMPLAAATLASLLSYYSTLVKETKDTQSAAANNNKSAVKTIPVIPCHA